MRRRKHSAEYIRNKEVEKQKKELRDAMRQLGHSPSHFKEVKFPSRTYYYTTCQTCFKNGYVEAGNAPYGIALTEGRCKRPKCATKN